MTETTTLEIIQDNGDGPVPIRIPNVVSFKEIKPDTAPECDHHIWFMGADDMVCANCKLAIKPEPLDIGKWDGTLPAYNADKREWEWIKQ